jgi:hypothetical protein
MRKKGQAALEFMMTYAWAIIAFAAIFYYDPFNLKTRLPEQAMFPPPLPSMDFASEPNGRFMVKLRNDLDQPIALLPTGYEGTDDCEGFNDFTFNQSVVAPYDDFIVYFTCLGTEGKRINAYLSFQYNNTANNVTHTETGYVVLNMK